MTSIAGTNCNNKQLADFGSTNKQPKRITTASKKPQLQSSFDDTGSYMGSSHFSNSKQLVNPFNPDMSGMLSSHAGNNDTSMAPSQISYEDGFPNAEFNAVTEEERARRRKNEKESRMQEFMEKTKKNAAAKLQNEQQARISAAQIKQDKERERVLKAKDYAKKQRELILKQAEAKKAGVSQNKIEQPAVGQHAEESKHVHFGSEAIQEVSEEQNESSFMAQSATAQKQARAVLAEQRHHEHVEEAHKLQLIEQFQRIDGNELAILGVTGDKQELPAEAIPEIHSYTMLQRFRQGRDLKAPNNAVARETKSKKITADGKENKWWLQQQQQTGAQQKQSIEKTRYVKALRVMVEEKGIPSLCICGAKQEKGKKEMCASNCQFYKNEKEYERALRDIIASTQSQT